MQIRPIILSALLAVTAHALAAQPGIPGQYRMNGFAVGCQANTFSLFSVLEAIEKTAQAGGRIIEFFPDQKLSREEPHVLWNHNASDAVIAQVQAKLKETRILAVNYGVVPVPKEEEGARRVFDFARKMGLRAITTESVESVDTLERLAKEYDIAVAFHHHPRRPDRPDYKLWDPQFIASLVRGRDRRIGACVDTGNWTRSGVRPLEGLRILKGRIIAVHLKDMNKFGVRDAHEVPFGAGASEVAACLKELVSQRFSGTIAVEYEFNREDNLAEVRKCIEFLGNYRR
jgi:sugar phosphate isomerase/epimerase